VTVFVGDPVWVAVLETVADPVTEALCETLTDPDPDGLEPVEEEDELIEAEDIELLEIEDVHPTG